MMPSHKRSTENVVRILNEGVHALIKAVRILIKPPKGMSKKEALLEALKIISASFIATIEVILTEASFCSFNWRGFRRNTYRDSFGNRCLCY